MRYTTLCYLENPAGEYLMLHRVKKENDCNRDKWIGIGGKFLDGESPEECALREIREETGLTVTGYRYRGIVTFVSDRWETEYMHLFTATEWTGRVREDCDEGVLEWIHKDRLAALPQWAGDRIFLDLLRQDMPFFSLKLRYQGYVRALAAHGLPLEQELVIEAGSFDIRQSYLAMQRRLLAGAQFTALFAISDNMAIGAMRALREAGRRIPEDCSVIAIDGLTVSDYINPTLTTLCQPMEHMGRRSVEILLDMVEHRGGPIRETAHTTLRTGESVRDIS